MRGYPGRLAAIAVLCLGTSAVAQVESVFVDFGHTRGRYPDGRLFLDSTGKLYATTELGGEEARGPGRWGTVVELSKHGGRRSVVLHTFGLLDGGFLEGGVIKDASGVIYGNASLGATDGCGIVYSLQQQNGVWTETTLHGFAYGGDGCVPVGEIVEDAAGNLYGVTGIGGAYSSGTVFELVKAKKWTEKILYNFTGGSDGNRPQNIFMDSSGTIFGTAAEGGTNSDGVVFQLARSGKTWTETVLHRFGGNGDGYGTPLGALAVDASGNLYGATAYGGENGAGSVFELSPTNGSWTAATLYSFTGGNDGDQPSDGVTLASGALYGVTAKGGSGGGGTVYALTESNGSWSESVLHSFPSSGTSDGSLPAARPIVDAEGTIFGTTIYGGNANRGVAYKIVP